MNQLKHLSSFVDEKELKKLDTIKDELSDAWNKRQVFRTETEARFAVLNDFKYPTKASKYWQAVREQMAHFEELLGLSFTLRRSKIDLDEVEEKLKTAKSFDKQRLEVDRDELLYSIKSGEQVAKHRIREVMQWSMLKDEVNDGSFDDKDVNTHQRESLFKSVLNHANNAPSTLSSEERLSINGVLYGLGKEEVNKELVKQLNDKNPNK